MSGLVAEAPDPRAVIVAFHGGASTAAYFDCPGHPRLSMLRAGAALGYTVVALDRPGYGASAPYPDAMQRPEQRVALAYGAVDKILGASPRGAGLLLLGHSAGCELAVRMAADERAEQASVIGLELAGTGVEYHPATAEILKTATATERPKGLRDIALAARRPVSGRRPVRHDELDVRRHVRGRHDQKWPQQDFPALAARVSVPVQFTRRRTRAGVAVGSGRHRGDRRDVQLRRRGS